MEDENYASNLQHFHRDKQITDINIYKTVENYNISLL